MASIKHVHPEAGCHVLLIDGDATHAKSEDAFTAHTWRELGLHGYLRRAFVNSAGGLCCMLKPVFVAWLLRQQQAEAVIYTDADTRFYNTTDHLVRAAINASFNLTPHILSPLSTPSPLRSDAAIARAGTYNGGLFTARRDASALAILDWWAESMWREAWLDHAYAWDQIWLSLLRQLFPATCVFSHPSHNVAYWNLDQRPLVRRGDSSCAMAIFSLIFISVFLIPTTPGCSSATTPKKFRPRMPRRRNYAPTTPPNFARPIPTAHRPSPTVSPASTTAPPSPRDIAIFTASTCSPRPTKNTIPSIRTTPSETTAALTAFTAHKPPPPASDAQSCAP
jgi:hypothetical protein